MKSNSILRRAATSAAVSLSLCSVAAPARADWPDKPIRIVVPSSPGGSADAVARMLADRLTKELGQSVIVDNRGGGGGNIATEMVARSIPNGYTFLLTGNNHTVNVSLFARPPYKLEDFEPVIEVTRGPSVFVAANNAPFKTLREMIAQSKASPASMAYGSPGVGLPSHIAFELFQRESGTSFAHAPYKGSGPSLADAAGGQIPVVASTLAAAMPLIKAGKVKPLAVTSTERWPSLPDVPTVTEVIGGSYVHLTWLGIFAPKGTPQPIVTRVNGAINKFLQQPDFKANLETLGTNPVGGSSVAFQKMIDAEYLSARALIQSAKLRAD